MVSNPQLLPGWSRLSLPSRQLRQMSLSQADESVTSWGLQKSQALVGH